MAELSRRFGPEMGKWTLGDYHYARIFSPMSGRWVRISRRSLTSGMLRGAGTLFCDGYRGAWR